MYEGNNETLSIHFSEKQKRKGKKCLEALL